MKPIQLFDPASSTYTYVLFDEASRDAIIIDPVDVQLERDLATLRQYGLKLLWTVETHAHADHITSAGQLAELAGAKTAAPEGCGITTAAVQLKDGDTLHFGNEQIRALHTPGHTPGSIALYLDREGKCVLFGQDIHGPFNAAFGSDIEVWKKSMQTLLALNADILCEGHFGIFQPKEKVRGYIERYLEEYE